MLPFRVALVLSPRQSPKMPSLHNWIIGMGSSSSCIRTALKTFIKRTAVAPALLAVYYTFCSKKSCGDGRQYPRLSLLTKYPRTAGPRGQGRPVSIPNNTDYIFENKRSNLSIWASQGELAGVLLISQMPSGEGPFTR